MTDQTDQGYDGLWSFLEEGGFDTPIPLASKSHPYLKDDDGRVQRDAQGRPLGGKVYHVESPDAMTGARMSALADIAKATQSGGAVKPSDVAKLNMNDEEEREFGEQVLGRTLAEMELDGVEWTIIQRMIQYGYIYFAMGADTAMKAAQEGLFSGGKARVPATGRPAPQDHLPRRMRRTQ